MTTEFNYLLPIFDVIPLPCIVLYLNNSQYTIKNVNTAYENLTNTKKAQLVDKNLSIVFLTNNTTEPTPQVYTAITAAINTVITTKLSIKLSDVTLNITDDETMHSCAELAPLLTKSGDIAAILLSFTDIKSSTQINAIDTIKSNQTAIINSTDDIIFSVDKNFRLVTINNTYQQLLHAITGRLEKEGDEIFTGRLGKELTNKWKTYFEKAFKGEKFSIQEAIYNPFKGYKQYGLINFNPVFNANGTVDSVACFAKDITASTVSFLELEKSKIELEKIFTASLDVICAVDGNNIFIKVSAASLQVWGYLPEEMIGHSIFEFIHPSYQQATLSIIKDIRESSTTINFENKYIKKDGSVATIEWSASWDAKEQIRYGVARDITQKKKNEIALIESEKQYKHLFENSPLPMYICDFATKKILNCNNEALELYGYTREHFLGLTTFDIGLTEDMPLLLATAANKEAYNEIYKNIIKHKKKNGDIIQVSIHEHFLNYHGAKASLVLVNDITEKLKIENAIKQTNERYEYVLKATSDAIWDWDLEKDTILWGEGLETLFGYNIQVFTQGGINLHTSLIHPSDIQRLNESFVRIVKSNQTNWEENYRFKKADGNYAYIIDKGFVIRNEAGKTIRIVGAKRDITSYRYLNELEKLERNILAAGKIGDKNVGETLKMYLLGLEALHPNMICSINEKKGNQLFHLAAPSLPQGFIDKANGISIGNNVGSCGTASYLKEKVIVSDTANDPHWADIKEVAKAYNLAACWSYPIISQQNEVIGTFAVYHNFIKTPSEQEENTINRAVSIIQIILENAIRTYALEESNLRYKYVTKATTDAIYDWDLEKDILFLGDIFSTIFGWRNDEIQEKKKLWSHLIHLEDRDKVVESLLQAVHGTASNWHSEYRFLKADGTYAYVVDRAYIIRNNSGKAVRIVGAKRDVTNRNKEILRLKLLESVILNTSDAIVITQAEPTSLPGPEIVYVNNAFTIMTGYTAEEIIGKTPRILQGTKTDQNELDVLRNALKKWEAVSVTLLNYRKDGSEFWVNISISPVANEKGWYTHWIAIQRDVTEKVLEHQKFNKAIIKTQEDERYEIGGELHDNVCQILTSSQISLKMLRKYLPEQDQHRLNESLEQIALATHEIRNLSHRLAPAFFTDTTIEEAFTNLVRTFNIENNYQISIYFDDAFKQQPAKREFQLNMYRILQEQLKNILKHAKATIIKVTGTVEGSSLKIVVLDNGVGFDINNVKNGIGLANMKRRAELFSGIFNIQSAINQGCILTIEVPVKEITEQF